MAIPLESHTPLSLTWVCRASCMGGGRSRGVAHTEGRQWPPPWQRPRPGAEAVRREPEQEEEGGGAGLRPRSPAGRQGVYYPAACGAGPHLPSSRRVHGARALGALSWPPTPASQLPAGAGRQRGPGFGQTHTALLVSV